MKTGEGWGVSGERERRMNTTGREKWGGIEEEFKNLVLGESETGREGADEYWDYRVTSRKCGIRKQ